MAKKHTRKSKTQTWTRHPRRAEVRRLTALGQNPHEIAAALGVMEKTVRRDIAAHRAAAKKRDPWADPAACAAAFIEDAEDALQKVRTAQQAADQKKDQTIYHNLVKLEWQMLIKFVQMNRPRGEPNTAQDDDKSPSFEELLQEARDLGVDVTPYESHPHHDQLHHPEDAAA